MEVLLRKTSSRELFEQVIKPWTVCSSTAKDYGVDASVEITLLLSRSKGQIVSGKRFSVQLKSTESQKIAGDRMSLSVAIEKINYWYSAVEPVILVYVDLKEGRCYYRCIDEHLTEELFRINEELTKGHKASYFHLNDS